jgi:hypothetical protein
MSARNRQLVSMAKSQQSRMTLEDSLARIAYGDVTRLEGMNEVMGEWGKAKAKNIRVASVFIGVRARYRTFLAVGEA